MARILDRLSSVNAAHPSQVYRWSQRVCEQIEAALTDIQTNQANIFAALSSMPDIADIHIAADYTGTANPDQFPVAVQAERLTNDTDNTTDATWSFTASPDAVTATIADGLLEITGATATCDITVSSVYGGVTKSRRFTAYLDVAAPPATGTDAGGGGTAGTTATDTSFTNFNSTTHAAVSDELTVTVSSDGTVDLSAPLTVGTGAFIPTGTFKVWAIWRHWNGSSWADVGTEVDSDPDCVYSRSGVTSGSLNVAQSVTGLTGGASEKFQLYARNDSGTRTMTLYGTASAVG